MDFNGTYDFSASRNKVYAAFFDATVLAAAIPGCQKATWIDPQTVELVVDLNIPLVKGTYLGRLQVSEQEEPAHFKLSIQRPQITGSATIDLAVDGGKTKLSYTGDAELHGKLKAADNVIAAQAAKVLLGQFFKGIEKQIGG